MQFTHGVHSSVYLIIKGYMMYVCECVCMYFHI